MPFLRRSAMMAVCDDCGRTFDPVRGAVCPRCNRLLCGRDFYGGFVRRMLGYLGVPTVCVQCRGQGR